MTRRRTFRSGSTTGRWWFVMLLFALPATSAFAAEVEVCADDEPGQLVSEALVRVRAELEAAGFSVEPAACGLSQVELGRIAFQRRGETLEIRATAVISHGTMIQTADLSQPAMTAEVIAVRAVEAFRAVLLQSLRSGELKQEQISNSLREFTQFRTDEESPAIAPEKPVERREASQGTARRSQEPRFAGKLSALFSLGPQSEVQPGIPSFSLGVEARGLVHYQGLSLGVVGASDLYPAHFRLGGSSATGRSWSILLRPGVRLACPSSWECHLGALVGIYQVKVLVEEATAEHSAYQHQTWTVQGDALVGRFFEHGLGVVAQMRGGALLDSPAWTSTRDDQKVRWGRPLLSFSLALAYRL